MIDVLRYIEKMKEMYEGERITAQEPRTLLAEYKPGDAEIELERTEVLRPKRIDILGNVIPAETLEDYDTRFVRPNAEGGRTMAQGGTIIPPEKPRLPQIKIFADKLRTYLKAGAIKKDYATQLLKDKMNELGVSDAELGTIIGRRGEAEGGRIGYEPGGRVSVEGINNLFIITHADGKKMYEAGVISKNTELGPAMKRRFPFTEQGKKDSIEAIKAHKEKYPNISKKTVYQGQTTIQKGKDGVLRYQRKDQPTKYYDPKKYGSEAKAFAAAQKDVEAAQVAKKTAPMKKVDIEEIRKLRAKGWSQAKIGKKLGVDQRTIADRLVKAGEYTKELNIRIVPSEVQKDIKGKYSQVKNWDFKKYTYGVSPTADKRLFDRIRHFVDEPTPYRIAVDFSTPQGWMAAQMDRSYKLGNTDYEPVRSKINNKSKIIGFIDNTKFGGGKKYMVAERFLKGKNADGVLFSNHMDYKNTEKLIDISKKAKLPVQGVLKDLLTNEGIDTTRISLSDLFKHMKDKVGYDGVKNALERHHISGVKSRATGNYQLLDRDLNALAREVTKEIELGDLSRVSELKKRGAMVEIGGKTYGAGPKTPGGQFRRFEKGITDFYSKSENIQKFKNTLSKTFQNLSPQSVLQMGRTHGCLKKQEGGSIMRCLQTKFNDDPAKFLQRSAPLAKGNPNLLKWFKTGKNIARGTGVFAAWEAVFAPVLVGWMATEGESWDRMKHDLAYGPILEALGVSPKFVPGISEKEEFMEAAGGDEKVYAAKRIDEIGQELPYLQAELNAAINEYAHVEGKGYKQFQIEKKIKAKKQELQEYLNIPEFYEGPAGAYIDVPTAGGAFTKKDEAIAKVAADKEARLEEYREKGYVAPKDWLQQQQWQYRLPQAGGGLTRTVAPDSGPMSQGLRSLYINDKDY